jgi:hypothetical protein
MKEKKQSPYHHLFRILHWVLGLGMPLLIATGVALHSVARPDWSLINHYVSWFPGGQPMFWHLIGALAFVPAAIISGVIFLMRYQSSSVGGWSWRWVANFLLMIGAGISFITAFGLLCNVPNNLYHASRFLHSLSGVVILPLAFMVHMILALTTHIKVLPFVFFPFRHARWSAFVWIPVIGIVTTLLLLQLPAKKSKSHRLEAEKIEAVADGMQAVQALDWSNAKPLNTHLVNGIGFNKGVSELELRAKYDDTYLYVRAVWTDPTENTLYWPVKRTADGWEYMQDSAADEQSHYEDKFSMIFPIEEDPMFNQFGCAISCHQSEDEERFPYGYKASKEKIDVWHWKASRSGSVGFIDDKYWHTADMDRKDVGRYGDSGIPGPYTKNISKDKTHPLYLPKDDSYIINKGGALLREGAVEYTEELAAKIPEGTLIPGVVVSPFEGDRGDVRCISSFEDNRHTLWIRRRLDTGSKDDVVFSPGKSIAFAASAFDHAAKRHAYHMTTYRLLLKK